MFGRRSDGTYIKNMDIIVRMTPYFMPQRIDAINSIMNQVRCETMDSWIYEKRKVTGGGSFNYMHIVIAALVRLLYVRPQLNRFIMNGKIYQRKGISITITVKKRLTDDGEEATVKLPFTGKENIYEVREIVNQAIRENISTANSTETTAKSLHKLPGWLLKFAMATIRFIDRHGMLPKKLIKASPFHTSAWVTNLKSIKIDAIFHHIYNFGTSGIFIAMGKEKMAPVVEGGELGVGKVMNIGITMDERYCDGFYFGKSLRMFNEIIEHPEILEKGPDDLI